VNFLDSTSAIPNALSSDPLSPETSQRLLRFSLDHQDDALLPLIQIVEILRLDITEILPIPDLPSWVLGVYNWRGEMLWLVDFNALFNYPPILQKQGTAFGLVVQEGQQSLGFVVSQVHDIELHDLQDLQPVVSNLFSPNLLPFIVGVLPKSSDPVLDVSAIARSDLWQKSRTNSEIF
jgi:positive phototaxis protein PixI